MGNFFWYYLIDRRVQQFNDKWYTAKTDSVDTALELLHDMFEFASTRPDIGTKVVQLVSSMLRSKVPSYR